MKRQGLFQKRRPPVGSRPGVLAKVSGAVSPKIQVISYTKDKLEESPVVDVESLEKLKNTSSVSWIDIQGFGDTSFLEKVAEVFEIHPLALADVVNIPTRSKAEEYENQIFVIASMVSTSEVYRVDAEQVSLFFGKGFVLTIQERYGDLFEPVRNRIRQGKGPIRKSESDYLAYALIDAIVDGYYPVLESFGEYLEALEEEVIHSPTSATMQKIYAGKRELLSLRRAIWPQREALSALIKNENRLVKKATKTYLRDTYDHCAQIMDVVETYRELCGGFTDLYLSSVSNKMNEVMKVLTIIATIFIPLSFLAGVYGMNFEYIPELKYRYSYFIFWGVIIVVAGAMILFFKRQGWLTQEEKRESH